MPVYAYKALDAGGRRVSGSLTADTPAMGRETVQAWGLQLVDFSETRFRKERRATGSSCSRRRQDATAAFARQLSLLLRAGVPLVDGLDVLIRQETGRLLPVLRDVRERVAEGTPFDSALARHPQWFDAVFRSAVSVGQMSGQLDAALRELADYVRERQDLRHRLFAAMAYPMVLVVVATGVVLFLMSYVVPQLLHVLEESGRPLPAATRLLKGASDALLGHWAELAAGAVVLAFALAAVYRWPAGRRFCHAGQLRLPLAGPLLRKSLVAQFSQMMALLLNSGVAFLDALRLVRANCRNLVLAGELEALEKAINRGSDIAPVLVGSRIFPPLVVHVVNVGQKSGELAAMLGQLDAGYRTEVRLAVDKFSAALEPLLIVVMSCVVGFIVFATMMPILEATRAIH